MTQQFEDVIFWSINGKGRVIKRHGEMIAQRLVNEQRDRWEPAKDRQLAGLLRAALSVANLRNGEEVVFWSGCNIVKGTYFGRAPGDQHRINVSPGNDTYANKLLPLHLAVEEGYWPFTRGMEVVAHYEGDWVLATWLCYEGGWHRVNIKNGARWNTEQAHSVENAIERDIVVKTTAKELFEINLWPSFIDTLPEAERHQWADLRVYIEYLSKGQEDLWGPDRLAQLREEFNEPIILSWKQSHALGLGYGRGRQPQAKS